MPPLQTPAVGYASEAYAFALAEFGTPFRLPRSSAWLLKRPIPGSTAHDALGGYPLLVCADWSRLEEDLRELGHDLVSLTAVPDPFGNYRIEQLHRCFPDRVALFKQHYVADLNQPAGRFVSSHHRQYARKAANHVRVEFCDKPIRYLNEWMTLFRLAVRRFHLTGIRAFSRASFARQFTAPGVVMSLAWSADQLVAAHVQIIRGDVVFAHLAASSDRGRRLGADYALYLAEIHHYARRARWIDWGGDAGTSTSPGSTGLVSFKRGWSTETRPAYICGRIVDHRRYAQLAERTGSAGTDYFPAYRRGEFR